MMKIYIGLLMSLLSTTAYADGSAYGGRHEIAVDGINGSFRHVHNWSSQKRKEIFFDTASPDRIFTSDNDFSYVEFIDRQGKVLMREPSPALTQLAVYEDSYFIGLSNIKSYNTYQLVVWNGEGSVIYKKRLESHVAKLTLQELKGFKKKFPKADKLFKPYYFYYEDNLYCTCLDLGAQNKIKKEAWQFLWQRRVQHPSIYSSESTSNYIFWMKFPLEFDKQNNLNVSTQKGEPIIIPLGKSIRLIGSPVGTITKDLN